MKAYPRESAPLDWAMVQNNIGTTLCVLGERESDTTRLEQSVVALKAALSERTREHVPFERASTLYNLGNVFLRLGQKKENLSDLKQSIAFYTEALETYPKEGAPLLWAMVQSNLGVALSTLGALGGQESGTASFEAAESAYRLALEVFAEAKLTNKQEEIRFNIKTLQTLIQDRKAGGSTPKAN